VIDQPAHVVVNIDHADFDFCTGVSTMKILQVLPTLSAGGAEGFVTNLGVSLAALGADVRFFILAGARGERGQVLWQRLQDAGIEVVGTEERNIRSPKNLLRLAGLIRSWRPDVVQANIFSTEFVCALVSLFPVGNSVRFTRRLANTNFQEYKSPTVMYQLDRFFDLTIACSSAVEISYRRFMRDKVENFVTTIPNGGLLLEEISDTREKQQARRDLGLPRANFVVTHIGRMFGADRANQSLQTGQKAHDILIKSFAQAFGGDVDKLLVLVGDGPLRSEAEELTRDLGITRQTHFLGQQQEPWPALKAADMFCFPSRWEGLPNVLPEAASCGLPIVASDIREIRDLYLGEAWLLKPIDDVEGFADGMRKIAANIADYRNFAAAIAPEIRERFSMDTCAKQYLVAYDGALKRGRK
jgi:glycosyltransferase involved in cell wall biosynthesis